MVFDTFLASYLIEPNRAAYTVEAMLDDAAIEPEVQAEEETAALIRSAYGALVLRRGWPAAWRSATARGCWPTSSCRW